MELSVHFTGLAESVSLFQVFLRKLNHYKAKRDESKVKKLYANRPEYDLDRMVKER